MGTGILLCGLNGVGKSTLGRALAQRLDYRFIDSEDLFFPKESPADPYGAQRSRAEAEALLMREVEAYPDFVFASVKGDCPALLPLIRWAVLLAVPRAERLRRVRERSSRRFGRRMLPGGDLYEREEEFLRFVEARPEDAVEEWLRSVRCPVIRADGTRPLAENVERIVENINQIGEIPDEKRI